MNFELRRENWCDSYLYANNAVTHIWVILRDDEINELKLKRVEKIVNKFTLKNLSNDG